MIKVAVVHEWFTALAGSEKVVEQLCGLYPELDLFAVFADPTAVASMDFLRDKALTTSFIQNLPKASTHFRNYLMLMPLAVEQFDLSAYDVIISSAHAVAKGVITGPDQLHISYVHTPIRYAWDLQHQYLRESKLDQGIKGWVAKWMLHKMRMWDQRTAAGVDHFVANSQYIARRIRKVYRREAEVIYPPVDVSGFALGARHEDFYLVVSRLVPYKKIDLIVEAFTATPDRKLVVIGDGTEMPKIKAKAGSNIAILGYQPDEVVKDMMQRARAVVFAAEEDFGITMVEAQASGAPVIALGRGGATEIVIGLGTSSKPTGVFFATQEVSEVIGAINTFEQHEDEFEPVNCRSNALRFSRERFRNEFQRYVLRRRFEHQEMRPNVAPLHEVEAQQAATARPFRVAAGRGIGSDVVLP
jgi:glycosyltransferase involved in cell wall biosynthesis